MIGAVDQGRRAFRAEDARHEAAMGELDKSVKRREEEARAVLRLELMGADATFRKKGRSEVVILPSARPLETRCDEGRRKSKTWETARERDGRIFVAAALQLAENKVAGQPPKKTGYLRKRQGKSSWRFYRVVVDEKWLTYAPCDDLLTTAATTNTTPRTSFASPSTTNSSKKKSSVKEKQDSKERRLQLLKHRVSLGQPLDSARQQQQQQQHPQRRTTQQENWIFTIVSKETEHCSVWMAASRQERDDWIEALKRSSKGGQESRGGDSDDVSDDDSSDSTIDDDERCVAAFQKVVDRVRRVSCREDFVEAVCANATPRDERERHEEGDAFPATAAKFRVPAAWARDQTQRNRRETTTTTTTTKTPTSWHRKLRGTNEAAPPRLRRGSSKNDEEESSYVDRVARQFTQMKKDMRRDRVSVDGALVAAADAEGYEEAIARVLANRIFEEATGTSCGDHHRDAWPSFTSQNQDDDLAALSESAALVHACAVLVACTRTCSGGEAYACVDALCQPIKHKIVLCPLSNDASPLELKVTKVHSKVDGGSGAPATFGRRQQSCDLESPRSSSPSSFKQRFLGFTFGHTAEQQGHQLQQQGHQLQQHSNAGAHSSDATSSTAQTKTKKAQTKAKKNTRNPPRVDVSVRATALYKICTSDPQDLPSDTWVLVRTAWTRTFSISGDNDVHASDAHVDMAISDAGWFAEVVAS